MPRSEIVTYPANAFEDERGYIRNLLNQPLNHVAIFTRKKGSVFANHWHPVREWSPRDDQIIAGMMPTEPFNAETDLRYLKDPRGKWWRGNVQFMYLISGSYRMVSQEITLEGVLVPDTRVEQVVTAGALCACGPLLAHAYEALEDSLILNINSEHRHAGGYGMHTIALSPGDRLIPYPEGFMP